MPLPWPICPSRAGGEGASVLLLLLSGTGADSDSADGPVVEAATVGFFAALAAGSSSPADLLLLVMDGRAVFSDSMPPPARRSLSLRFSLRACDFEYGARDASSPETSDGRSGSRDETRRVRGGNKKTARSQKKEGRKRKKKNVRRYSQRYGNNNMRHIRSMKSSCLRIRFSFLFK